MDRTYLDWTIVNWITVALMAFTGMAIVAVAANGLRHVMGNSSETDPNSQGMTG